MIITKYEKYVSELNGCVRQVIKAVNSGALLTQMELMDFYFKKNLISRKRASIKKMIKDTPYRVARFYAVSFEGLQQIKTKGYTNSEAESYAKEMCKNAYFMGMTRSTYTISSYDSNGSFFLDLKCRGEHEYTFELKSIKDFVQAMLALMSFFASSTLKDGEFKEFVEGYIVNVYNDIMSAKTPTPYIYSGAAKTLKSFIRKNNSKNNTAVSDEDKIVKFRVG